MRILVTGGAGYIGSNIAFALQEKYPHAHIVVWDDFSSGDFKTLIGFKGEVVAGCITDPAAQARIRAMGPFNVIYHEAAITDTTVLDQKKMVEVNTNAFADILEMALHWHAQVIYASSAGVYGNSPAPNRIHEGLVPANVYGFSKYAMDQISARYWREHPTLQVVGMRYFNVYGPGEWHKGKTSSMILQLCRQMLDGKQPRIFKYGEQMRDFVYIGDVVQANLKAMSAGRSGVVNVGSGKARSFNDIVSNLNRVLGLNLEIEYFDNPYDFFQNHTEADITETRALLGYEPEYTLEQGIEAYVPHIVERFGKK